MRSVNIFRTGLFFLPKASLKQSDYLDIWICAYDNEQDRFGFEFLA